MWSVPWFPRRRTGSWRASIDDAPRGVPLIAIDSVGAGIGEKVLVVIEGKAAGDALGKKAAAVDAAIIGIIDTITCNAEC